MRKASSVMLMMVCAVASVGCPPVNQSQLTLFEGDPELVGTWSGTISISGTDLSGDVRLLFTETTLTYVETLSDGSIATISGDYGVDTSKDPHWIDFARRSNSANIPNHNNLSRGVYELDGDALTWAATADPVLPRPSTVNSAVGIVEVIRETRKNGGNGQPPLILGIL
jgi:uncharacterized protein (TIGR03067 family)